MMHTPGPWKVRFMGGEDDGQNQFFVEAKNNNKPELGYGIEILMDDYGDHNGYTREQRLGDAHLIACAPEMLEALKKAEKHHQGGHSEIGHMLREIIAKAEGGTP